MYRKRLLALRWLFLMNYKSILRVYISYCSNNNKLFHFYLYVNVHVHVNVYYYYEGLFFGYHNIIYNNYLFYYIIIEIIIINI
jgi:hypothetical protein